MVVALAFFCGKDCGCSRDALGTSFLSLCLCLSVGLSVSPSAFPRNNQKLIEGRQELRCKTPPTNSDFTLIEKQKIRKRPENDFCKTYKKRKLCRKRWKLNKTIVFKKKKIRSAPSMAMRNSTLRWFMLARSSLPCTIKFQPDHRLCVRCTQDHVAFVRL